MTRRPAHVCLGPSAILIDQRSTNPRSRLGPGRASTRVETIPLQSAARFGTANPKDPPGAMTRPMRSLYENRRLLKCLAALTPQG